MQISEKEMIKRIYGFKRNETTGSYRKLHNEDLHMKEYGIDGDMR
jgi:hypothetical protein